MNEENKNQKSEPALREEKVLEFWGANKIFEKSTKAREGKKEFVFYEGPPTANGKPGIHHLAARAFKDAIPRYKTMRGYHVRRKGGWDTHGLPVELQVEKKLGLNSKKAIEEYGIAKFNKECKESVWEYLDVWNKFTKRIGYWVDQENPYVTYDNKFIESVWNVVKTTNDQNLLYKDYKVVPWCPRCGTALSSHELAQGYEDVKDLSIYAKFKVKGQEDTYIVAWTTTPWTLPGNVALAVGKDITYAKYNWAGESYIIAKDRAGKWPGHVQEEFLGKDMVGWEYEPLFPYLKDKNPEKVENAFKVYAADFVTTTDGTGVVHTAVMYGQDDFELGTKVGLPKYHMVNLEGKFVEGTGFLEGRFVKEKSEDGKPTLDVDIIKYLQDNKLYFDKELYQHSYPHCWRCKTALIYYARDSWYVKMSGPEVKGKMISENKTINWEPSHIREGRFGEWLREIKDWAISRERYWGTPLPVWDCTQCEKREVIGGLSDLKSKSKNSGNKYFVMRHGEALDNAKHIFDPQGDPDNHLTEKGKSEAVASAGTLKDKKIDFIYFSPFIRTRETAEVVHKELGLPKDALKVEDRLHEYNEDGIQPVMKRMGEFIYDMEKQYQGKNILIVSHGNPIWVLEKIAGTEDGNFNEKRMLNTGEVQELPFAPLPHNENYELDLHRPYIDEVKLVCDCGGDMVRTKEVLDVWLDSGCMPFAQDHYPFENKNWIEGAGYPADYICEAIDQTRGWFYTLHAVGVLMGRGKAYKNVICLGHLLDAKGKKMSKSLGNVVEPFEAMDKYGVDTLRLWMYSVNQPGESKNFDEKTVQLLQQQVFGLLYNVLFFYELYRDETLEDSNRPKSKNVLDVWILAKLDELVDHMTENMDSYKLLEPTRALRDFVGDLSTWYLRRSRERIKDNDKDAKKTLYYVLRTVAKLLAPLAPFSAEDIWQRIKHIGDKESVHLEDWPEKNTFGKIKFVFEKGKIKKVVMDMSTVREIVSKGLKERQMKNLPVKQPLGKIKIKIQLPKNFQSIIQEELNIKNIEQDKNMENDLHLDEEITPELKEEGNYRELMRMLQEMRKKMGLTPSDKIMLYVSGDEQSKALIRKFEGELKKTVLIENIAFQDNDGEEVKTGDLVFKVKIDKI